MVEATAVDVHAHFLGNDIPRFPEVAPQLVIDSGTTGRIVASGETFRVVSSMLWSVSERVADLDRLDVSHQVISPVPVTMEFAAQPGSDPAYARAINDSIAAACTESRGRLLGLACLPFGALDALVAELERCTRLGLHGFEIGTQVGHFDLDAPELSEFWAACAEADACVFVHPIDGGKGVIRRAGQPFDLGLGMLTDTAIAASSLVFGGVLERHPTLRVALAHGCGAFPWAYPRLTVAAGFDGKSSPEHWEALTRRLYADTLVFDDEHLRLLAHRLGVDRLVLGSDAPFFPDQLAKSISSIASARTSGALRDEVGLGMLARNALEFLGIAEAASPSS